MSTETGRLAEAAAAKFLQQQGLEILERNWRTRWCEIDIVAQRKGQVYFVEVKYRIGAAFGSGFDYITPRKLSQMRYAAAFWLGQQRQVYAECHISAIELSGTPPKVVAWLADV